VIGHLFDIAAYAKAFDLVILFPVVGSVGWWWLSQSADAEHAPAARRSIKG